LRGTLDSALDNEYGHLSKWDQAKKVIGPKALRGIGSAALVGYTVGHGLKETKGKKNSFSNRYLKPAAIGALTSAAGGLYESGLAEGFATPAARTRVAAKVGGKAAAGAAAGLFLSELMSRVLGKEKKASEQVPPPGPSGIYREVSSVARNADDKNLLQFYGDMHRRGAERTPSARAATYALHDELVRRGHSVETPKMREKVSPLMSPQTQDAGLVYAALSAPVAFLSVIDKSKTAKDQLMLDAVDQMYIRDQINWVKDPKLSLLGGHSAGTSITTHPDALLAEVAHELGHARGGVARKALRNIPHLDTARFVAAEVSILLPAFVVFGASDPSYSSPEELRQKASFLQTAGLALGAVQAPGIAEEVLATRDAVKILKSVGADSGDMARYSKVLGPALLTHAAPAALPFLASAVLRHRARKAEKSRSES
jgi:hypothetical protein